MLPAKPASIENQDVGPHIVVQEGNMIVNSKFKPAWWMRNRHAQTILPRLYPKPCDFQPLFQNFELSDGDFVELTWTQKPDAIPVGQPIVLVLHGLEGSLVRNKSKTISS